MMRLVGCLAVVHMVACSAPAQESNWKSEVLFECEHGMGGAAIGDLDPKCPGNEVVVVDAAGEVWLVRRTAGAWQPTRICQGDGEFIMCAIGDADPRHPGNELVCVGMVSGPEALAGPGHVVLLRAEGDAWSAEEIFRDDHMIHGVAIGDVSSHHPGSEVVACGFSHRVTLVWPDASGWSHETIYVTNDRLKIALAADVLPDHEGDEAVVCGSDGCVAALWQGDLGWHHQVIFSDPIGQSRIATDGSRVLIGGDGGKVTLATREAAGWKSEFLMRDEGKMRGVAIADVDRSIPGAELYACGYSARVTQLVQDEHGYWKSRVVFAAERALHHLVAGDIDPTHDGPELVTCGHGGQLITLWPED